MAQDHESTLGKYENHGKVKSMCEPLYCLGSQAQNEGEVASREIYKDVVKCHKYMHCVRYVFILFNISM